MNNDDFFEEIVLMKRRQPERESKKPVSKPSKKARTDLPEQERERGENREVSDRAIEKHENLIDQSQRELEEVLQLTETRYFHHDKKLHTKLIAKVDRVFDRLNELQISRRLELFYNAANELSPEARCIKIASILQKAGQISKNLNISKISSQTIEFLLSEVLIYRPDSSLISDSRLPTGHRPNLHSINSALMGIGALAYKKSIAGRLNPELLEYSLEKFLRSPQINDFLLATTVLNVGYLAELYLNTPLNTDLMELFLQKIVESGTPKSQNCSNVLSGVAYLAEDNRLNRPVSTDLVQKLICKILDYSAPDKFAIGTCINSLAKITRCNLLSKPFDTQIMVRAFRALKPLNKERSQNLDREQSFGRKRVFSIETCLSKLLNGLLSLVSINFLATAIDVEVIEEIILWFLELESFKNNPSSQYKEFYQDGMKIISLIRELNHKRLLNGALQPATVVKLLEKIISLESDFAGYFTAIETLTDLVDADNQDGFSFFLTTVSAILKHQTLPPKYAIELIPAFANYKDQHSAELDKLFYKIASYSFPCPTNLKRKLKASMELLKTHPQWFSALQNHLGDETSSELGFAPQSQIFSEKENERHDTPILHVTESGDFVSESVDFYRDYINSLKPTNRLETHLNDRPSRVDQADSNPSFESIDTTTAFEPINSEVRSSSISDKGREEEEEAQSVVVSDEPEVMDNYLSDFEPFVYSAKLNAKGEVLTIEVDSGEEEESEGLDPLLMNPEETETDIDESVNEHLGSERNSDADCVELALNSYQPAVDSDNSDLDSVVGSDVYSDDDEEEEEFQDFNFETLVECRSQLRQQRANPSKQPTRSATPSSQEARQYFIKTPKSQMQAEIKQSNAAHFFALFNRSSEHDRYLLLKSGLSRPLWLNLPLKELKKLVYKFISPFTVYKDHRSLLSIVSALNERCSKMPEDKTDLIHLQKTLILYGLNHHKKTNHKHVVPRLLAAQKEVDRVDLAQRAATESRQSSKPMNGVSLQSNKTNKIATKPSTNLIQPPAKKAATAINLIAKPNVNLIGEPEPKAVNSKENKARFFRSTRPAKNSSRPRVYSPNDEYFYEAEDMDIILRTRMPSNPSTICLAAVQLQGPSVNARLGAALINWKNHTYLAPGAQHTLFVPVQDSDRNHWFGLKIVLQGTQIKELVYFDGYLSPEAKSQQRAEIRRDLERWSLIPPQMKIKIGKAIPQNDLSSCGPLVIENFYCHVTGKKWTNQEDLMTKIRHRQLQLIKEKNPEYYAVFGPKQANNVNTVPDLSIQEVNHGFISY